MRSGFPFNCSTASKPPRKPRSFRAGYRGTVTIATNMAGRGTDIKLQPGVADLGGIHLIAVEPNESLRVDRQLIGRVGRQGDPGSYQFFVSADDALLLRFGAHFVETDE